MVIVFFLLKDKERRSYFFEKIFLLANFSIYIAFEILSFTPSNININLLIGISSGGCILSPRLF